MDKEVLEATNGWYGLCEMEEIAFIVGRKTREKFGSIYEMEYLIENMFSISDEEEEHYVGGALNREISGG